MSRAARKLNRAQRRTIERQQRRAGGSRPANPPTAAELDQVVRTLPGGRLVTGRDIERALQAMEPADARATQDAMRFALSRGHAGLKLAVWRVVEAKLDELDPPQSPPDLANEPDL